MKGSIQLQKAVAADLYLRVLRNIKTVLSEAEMEKKSKVGVNLVKIASVYMMVGLVNGLIMGLSGDHALATVHSHISLLGWTTMAITGLVYILNPRCANNK